MREIKFRGHTGESWVYGNLIQFTDSFGKDHAMIVETDGTPLGEWDVDVDPESVGQFTGLKDRNGVEIYEGDIVRVIEMPASPDEQDFMAAIKFDKGCFFVTDPRDNEPLFLGFFPDTHPNGYRPLTIETIGNIHEDPELVVGLKNAK